MKNNEESEGSLSALPKNTTRKSIRKRSGKNVGSKRATKLVKCSKVGMIEDGSLLKKESSKHTCKKSCSLMGTSQDDVYVPGRIGAMLALKNKDGTINENQADSERCDKKRPASSLTNSVFMKKTRTSDEVVTLPIRNEKVESQSPSEAFHARKIADKRGLRLLQRGKIGQVKKGGEEAKARTVYVGNVPLSESRKSIKKLFAQFGKIESVRMRSVIGKNEKIPKKVVALKHEFASNQQSLTFYVKFASDKDSVKALSLNGHTIDGHRMRVDSCAGPKKYDYKVTAFVGNIPFSATEDEVAEFFEKCGPVKCVRIIRDRESGRGKGFGFIVFEEASSLPIALKMDGASFQERSIRITKVLKKNKRLVSDKHLISKSYGSKTVEKYFKYGKRRPKINQRFGKNNEASLPKKVIERIKLKKKDSKPKSYMS
ncbi:hypothetical protein AB6A40_002194 [Gnathostoma spinigerum]|uniref:RRM domain-containing protein n=1 Tax=Gnathostoma spinigerum TaxID=75299 RepID=A0ABD6E5Z3_9BILA